MRTPVLSLTLLCLAAPAFAKPTTYTIDQEKSLVVVRVFKGGIAAGLAHDHAIQAKTFEGTLVYDPDDVTKSKVEVTVQAASLIADPPELVKKFKLPSSPSASDRKTVEANLKSEDQLWVEKYPTITFVSTGFKKLEKATYLTGKFTLRGVTKKVTFLVTLTPQKDGSLLGKGRFKVKQSDYGYEPYSALFGAIKVKDTGYVIVELVARPAAEPEPKKPAPKKPGK
jgi:polyisoprenoid-binding protein YceI